MKLLLEFNSFRYNVGDVVLIKYWFDDKLITPVKILEKKGSYFVVSHNVKQSKIWNAPNEQIKSLQIIDRYKNRD